MMGNYAATHTVVLEAVGLADYEATVQKRRSVSSQWIMGSSLECEQNISATFSSWRSKAASEFRLERSERSFNKYIASVYFNNDSATVASRADEFPAFVADLAYFVKRDESSFSSGSVTSRTRYTARAFVVGALRVSIPREAKPENDLGAGTFLSWFGLAVPLSFL
jgi:hypothetical protein